MGWKYPIFNSQMNLIYIIHRLKRKIILLHRERVHHRRVNKESILKKYTRRITYQTEKARAGKILQGADNR